MKIAKIVKTGLLLLLIAAGASTPIITANNSTAAPAETEIVMLLCEPYPDCVIYHNPKVEQLN